MARGRRTIGGTVSPRAQGVGRAKGRGRPDAVRFPWLNGLDWEHFIAATSRRLERHGYADSSIILYGRMLRKFGEWVARAPPDVSANDLREYLHHLADRHMTPGWVAQHISLFRLTWDELQGQLWTKGWRGPRRRTRMPQVLPPSEVMMCLTAARTWPERMALSLIYGASLRLEELRQLRWSDLDITQGEILIRAGGGRGVRRIPLPRRLAKLVEFAQAFVGDVHVIPGRRHGTPMSRRGVTALLSRVGVRARICRRLTASVLRDSSAVHALEQGVSIPHLCWVMGYTRSDVCRRVAMAACTAGRAGKAMQ